MMTNKNHTTIFVTVLLGLIFSGFIAGCADSLLNQTPRGQQTVKNFFRDENDAVQATNATYQILRGFSFAFQYIGMTDIASDDASKGSIQSDAPFMGELDDFTFTPTNAAFDATWTAYYNGVFRANQGITKIPDIDMDETLKARLVGENKFLRAYFYFFLLRAYGGVPLVKKPLVPGEFNVPRSSIDSTYDFIIQDLKDAANVLPLKSNYSSSDIGRATKGAAQGLLAKVYLFQKDYQDAQQMAEEVINSGQYSLLPDYGTIFTPEGENTSGTIFSTQAVAVANGTGGTQFGQVQGVRGQPNLGFGFNNPTRDLLQAYEPGDPRLESTVLFVYEELPDGSDVVRDNVNVVDERYNQKYFVPLSTPGGTGNGGSNIRRLRYSDILLTAAEAAYQNSDVANAQKYLNMVRQRARGGQTATLGINIERFSSLLADTTNASAMQGKPFIRYVSADGPGSPAGLKAFDWSLVNNNAALILNDIDVIQSVDGTTINSVADYNNQIKTKSPGETVNLNVMRITQTYNGGNVSTNKQNLQFSITAQALLPDITAAGQPLLDAIWHERRTELAMEQKRFFDLRRQGRAMQVLQAVGKNYTAKNDLYPIPQTQVDLGNLQQNPGYVGGN